jgi:hypothetical protein
LRSLPQKKKKNPCINQCGEKGGGRYYILVGLKNSEPSVPGIISTMKYGYGHTCLHSEPARKGLEKKKKPLVLTLGSPPEKGGKKNPCINPGQPGRTRAKSHFHL